MRSKQAMGSFVTFTFSTKFLCGVNQIVTVIAVIQIQNLCQAFMPKSRDLTSRNVNIQVRLLKLYIRISFLIIN
jgi:hypothetical protein